ncbi:hypothetical protein LDL59_15735 [Kaistella anthropi]|nr:hypothetical protein [Kaistella anthropi]
MIYVPRTANEIKLLDDAKIGTAAQQWTALNQFIAQDEYLSTRRGQYAERNGAKTPWEHRFDVRVSQDLGLKIGERVHKLQLTFDVFNVGNLLNKDWGRSYFVGNNAYSLINYDAKKVAILSRLLTKTKLITFRILHLNGKDNLVLDTSSKNKKTFRYQNPNNSLGFFIFAINI